MRGITNRPIKIPSDSQRTQNIQAQNNILHIKTQQLATTRKVLNIKQCITYTKSVTTLDPQINDIETMNKDTKTERYKCTDQKKVIATTY